MLNAYREHTPRTVTHLSTNPAQHRVEIFRYCTGTNYHIINYNLTHIYIFLVAKHKKWYNYMQNTNADAVAIAIALGS